MFYEQLNPLVEAASRALPVSVDTDAGDDAGSVGESRNGSGKSQHKRKPRKIIPEVKNFVEKYHERDVLFGRGELRSAFWIDDHGRSKTNIRTAAYVVRSCCFV